VTLPAFGFVCLHRRPLVDGVADEAEWARGCAATGRACAHLWQGEEGFVVPRRYTSLAGWVQRPSDLHLLVRASGGGLVPQGPGVWNLSLLWRPSPLRLPPHEGAVGGVGQPGALDGPAFSAVPSDTTAVYRALCTRLARAFARLGIDDAEPHAVQGSWCDGRFNLAVRGAKLAGTAQAWKRVDRVPVVLAHAVIIVTAEPDLLTARANACEAALGTHTRYRPDALTSVARCVAAVHGRDGADDHDNLESRTLTALAEQFARVVPPRGVGVGVGVGV
jgi:lipoate-protein ligase A